MMMNSTPPPRRTCRRRRATPSRRPIIMDRTSLPNDGPDFDDQMSDTTDELGPLSFATEDAASWNDDHDPLNDSAEFVEESKVQVQFCEMTAREMTEICDWWASKSPAPTTTTKTTTKTITSDPCCSMIVEPMPQPPMPQGDGDHLFDGSMDLSQLLVDDLEEQFDQGQSASLPNNSLLCDTPPESPNPIISNASSPPSLLPPTTTSPLPKTPERSNNNGRMNQSLSLLWSPLEYLFSPEQQAPITPTSANDEFQFDFSACLASPEEIHHVAKDQCQQVRRLLFQTQGMADELQELTETSATEDGDHDEQPLSLRIRSSKSTSLAFIDQKEQDDESFRKDDNQDDTEQQQFALDCDEEDEPIAASPNDITGRHDDSRNHPGTVPVLSPARISSECRQRRRRRRKVLQQSNKHTNQDDATRIVFPEQVELCHLDWSGRQRVQLWRLATGLEMKLLSNYVVPYLPLSVSLYLVHHPRRLRWLLLLFAWMILVATPIAIGWRLRSCQSPPLLGAKWLSEVVTAQQHLHKSNHPVSRHGAIPLLYGEPSHHDWLLEGCPSCAVPGTWNGNESTEHGRIY